MIYVYIYIYIYIHTFTQNNCKVCNNKYQKSGLSNATDTKLDPTSPQTSPESTSKDQIIVKVVPGAAKLAWRRTRRSQNRTPKYLYQTSRFDRNILGFCFRVVEPKDVPKGRSRTRRSQNRIPKCLYRTSQFDRDTLRLCFGMAKPEDAPKGRSRDPEKSPAIPKYDPKMSLSNQPV